MSVNVELEQKVNNNTQDSKSIMNINIHIIAAITCLRILHFQGTHYNGIRLPILCTV